MKLIIQIAGVPVEIICQHSQNKQFFDKYISDASPCMTICPTEENLYEMEQRQRAQAEQDGSPERLISSWLIENSAIHALLAEKLIDYGVLLVHGSAIVVDGEAFVFMADSGTGKSTHTRLWREFFQDRAWMLNDDKPMLKVEGDIIKAYGTPWDGKHHLSSNASVPVKAFAELSRGEVNYIEPLSTVDAMTLVCRYGMRPKSADLLVKSLQLETEIAQKVRAYHLYCNMDPEAAIVAYRGMTGGI